MLYFSPGENLTPLYIAFQYARSLYWAYSLICFLSVEFLKQFIHVTDRNAPINISKFIIIKNYNYVDNICEIQPNYKKLQIWL